MRMCCKLVGPGVGHSQNTRALCSIDCWQRRLDPTRLVGCATECRMPNIPNAHAQRQHASSRHCKYELSRGYPKKGVLLEVKHGIFVVEFFYYS